MKDLDKFKEQKSNFLMIIS